MKTRLVKVMYATHIKLLLVKFDYNKKHNEFYTLIRNEESFSLRCNNIPMKINDYTTLDEGELFQESLVIDSNIKIDIEIIKQYQTLLNKIMNCYPCRIEGNMQFKSKMYELWGFYVR